MAEMDIFHQDAFSMLTMTSAIERLPYLPDGLDTLGIFTDNPIRTRALAVEERDGVLSLVQTSERGAPINTERPTEKRKLRYFEVPRIVEGDTITADEIANIRAFGQGSNTQTEFMQVQDEVARRQSGPMGVLNQIRYTMEHMRLAAVQGILLDADGTQIYNWFDEFGFVLPDAYEFNLTAQTPNTLRILCNQITRSMARSSKGAMPPKSRVIGLCGDAFYDDFVNHVDVIRTFTNWSEAREIRDGAAGGAFDTFSFGGIDWVNYRGSDDNTTIKIPDSQVSFFPAGAPGVFERALAPAETFDYVNTPGKEYYVIPIFDRDRNMWWRQEIYSYPLFICKRPEVLRIGAA